MKKGCIRNESVAYGNRLISAPNTSNQALRLRLP